MAREDVRTGKIFITAEQLVALHGPNLVGRTVITEPMGVWPGGPCKVTEMGGDPRAPEIVFHVDHCDLGIRNSMPNMGVFSYEEVELVDE